MIESYTAMAYERPGEREVCKSENLPREGRISGGTDDIGKADPHRLDASGRPSLRIRRHVQRGRRTEPTGPGEKGRGRFPQEPTRPPEARSMHVMSPTNRVKRNVAEPQAGVRSRVRDERPPPGGPCQGHRASRGSA